MKQHVQLMIYTYISPGLTYYQTCKNKTRKLCLEYDDDMTALLFKLMQILEFDAKCSFAETYTFKSHACVLALAYTVDTGLATVDGRVRTSISPSMNYACTKHDRVWKHRPIIEAE